MKTKSLTSTLNLGRIVAIGLHRQPEQNDDPYINFIENPIRLSYGTFWNSFANFTASNKQQFYGYFICLSRPRRFM